MNIDIQVWLWIVRINITLVNVIFVCEHIAKRSENRFCPYKAINFKVILCIYDIKCFKIINRQSEIKISEWTKWILVTRFLIYHNMGAFHNVFMCLLFILRIFKSMRIILFFLHSVIVFCSSRTLNAHALRNIKHKKQNTNA